jgi:hypothetical protein
MTPKEKLIFMAVIPLAAAGMGAVATISTADNNEPQIVLTKGAVEAAKGEPIRVEVDIKNDWLKPLMPLSMLGGLALMYWAMGSWKP